MEWGWGGDEERRHGKKGGRGKQFMCFSKAASKIPKGEQMPKWTVLVYFRRDRQGESCQGFELDLQPGSQRQAYKTSPCLGVALRKGAGDRYLLLLVPSPLGFFPL